MKTFDEIYNELQSAENKELHDTWKEAKQQNDKAKKIAGILCFIADITLIILFGDIILKRISFISILVMLLYAIIINFGIFAIVTVFSGVSKKNIEFNKQFKNIVINKLMSNFYDNLEYFPYKGMPEYIYKQVQYEHYDKYRSDDYFEANINNKYGIQMAETHTQEVRTVRDKDGRTRTETITRFHGLFAKITLDKSINSELRIEPNGGAFLAKDRLEMDSSEFEKYFDVQASNKIIGMQLLTADVMEELIEFENKTKMKFDIYIRNDEIYLRFHSGAMFEAGGFKKHVLDRETIEKYFYMLNFTYNLANKIIKVINETEI